MNAHSPGPGQTLFSFVRHWSRRQLSGHPSESSQQGRIVLVTEAVDSLVLRGEPATVNAVAAEIGIDQSGASRLVAAATKSGHLVATVSANDARRREMTVTAAGRSLLSDAHAWQERVFGELTADWSERRRSEFERSMSELIDRSRELDGGGAL